MTQIKLRRDTSANFTSKNPILGVGEPAYETDTKKLKIGDGTTAYTQLEYFSSGGGGSADIGAALPLKIVDGVISLEVDGQTIQIVDGKLHASNNIFDISKFNVVGNPTITDDGIASGFSNKDYITIPFNKTVTNFKIHYPFKTLSMPTVSNFVLNGTVIFYMSKSGGTMSFGYGSARSGNVFMDANNWKPNTNYCLEVIRNSGNTVTFNFLNLDTNVILKSYDLDVTNVIPSIDILQLSKMNNMSIDLKQFLITVDGKEVFNGLMSSTKPIYDAIKASNTELSEFKTETSNDFSAVNSALNEKANLSDLALKQNKLTAGENITLTNLTDKTVRIDATYTGLEICDIGMALYIDETKGLRRYLNGQIVDINTNTQAFLNRLKEITTLHPSLLCTEEEWQTAKTMSAFGQVGKFVFNYSGDEIVSVRLPRVVNVQGLFDLQNLGMTVAESLPQHTHYIGDRLPSITSAGGNPKADVNGNDGYQCVRISNTQGASSSIYKDGAHVQQEAIQYPYFIQIATGSETEANIVNTLENVNGFTLLESKYSDKPLYNECWLLSSGQQNAKAVYPTVYEGLQVEYNTEIEAGTTVTLPSGVSYTKRGLSVKLSTEDYTDYDFVLNTTDETFRLPLLNGDESLPDNSSDKITTQIFNSSHPYTATERVFVTGSALTSGGGGGGFSHVFLNGKVIAREEGDFANFQLILNKGDVLTTTGTASDVKAQINIAPVVGNGTLYFYVGDIDQNHGIVNMGRIGEQLADKIGRTECKAYITETYVNGTSWYRIYSDGWCEQGGYNSNTSATINLLKQYTDTNYIVITTILARNSDLEYYATRVYNKTTSNFIMKGNNTGSMWQASGYIA